MTEMPSSQTPLYHHPLPALEHWDLHRPEWSAQIELEVDELKVSWHSDGQVCVRHFPYGLSRADAEAVILAGP